MHFASPVICHSATTCAHSKLHRLTPTPALFCIFCDFYNFFNPHQLVPGFALRHPSFLRHLTSFHTSCDLRSAQVSAKHCTAPSGTSLLFRHCGISVHTDLDPAVFLHQIILYHVRRLKRAARQPDAGHHNNHKQRHNGDRIASAESTTYTAATDRRS